MDTLGLVKAAHRFAFDKDRRLAIYDFLRQHAGVITPRLRGQFKISGPVS